MDIAQAKNSLDTIIKKARVHLYKPIQIAEILYRDRVVGDIRLLARIIINYLRRREKGKG